MATPTAPTSSIVALKGTAGISIRTMLTEAERTSATATMSNWSRVCTIALQMEGGQPKRRRDTYVGSNIQLLWIRVRWFVHCGYRATKIMPSTQPTTASTTAAAHSMYSNTAVDGIQDQHSSGTTHSQDRGGKSGARVLPGRFAKASARTTYLYVGKIVAVHATTSRLRTLCYSLSG